MEMNPVPGYKAANWSLGYGDFHLVPDLATLRVMGFTQREVAGVMIGTTHFTNAVVERRRHSFTAMKMQATPSQAAPGSPHTNRSMRVSTGSR